ncbi:MAG: C4-dicarboxylate-specific signal transduction histidine kinase [Bacteriovoracaceae bacterium]|jgi:C4-dicarboxylate-specific signal transduction histidine kinase
MKQELLSHLKEKSQGTLELIHTMDNYLFIIDLDGNILLSSDSITQRTNMEESYLKEAKFFDIIHTDENTSLNLFDLLLLNNKNADLSLLMFDQTKKNPIDTLLVSSSILSNFYKDQDYVLILLADMREHRKTQMQLMHSNKMVSLGEMASGIAHEINNPLTVVTGQLRLLKKQIERLDGENEKITTLSNKISINFDRITKIVKSLQTMSRGTEKSPMVDVQLESILSGVKDLTAQKLESKNVKFTVETNKEDISIFCRETEILQVLLNLINNSVDSIAQLDDKWVKLNIIESNTDIQITVTDSGSGINLDLQIRLFEPFYTTKSIGQGTGLGLSISKSLIESHGGTLSYDTGNMNTSFKIVLPK